jgi:hypothetical protein
VVVARTGFTDTDTFVGVKAADIPDFNHHCHLDAGSVVIHAAGQELLAENVHWQYPREGSKDPTAKPPSRPGLWDEELKRWKRWDLDSVGALGHNVGIVEGEYPRPVLHQPPCIRVVASTSNHDIVTVDSTAYYRPLATRVKRTVVFLRPDVVLLIDELRAVRPVRARLLFHYLEEAAVDGSDFRIVNGPALLLGRVLCPSRDDNLITGLDDRRTVYEPPPGLVERQNRYVYAENLWRRRRLTFVTALQVGATSLEPATFAIEGQPLQEPVWTVTVYGSRACRRVTMTPRGVLVESP